MVGWSETLARSLLEIGQVELLLESHYLLEIEWAVAWVDL